LRKENEPMRSLRGWTAARLAPATAVFVLIAALAGAPAAADVVIVAKTERSPGGDPK